MSVIDEAALAGSHHPVLEALFERINLRVPAERGDAVREFAKLYTRRFTEGELASADPERLFGEVIGSFELMDGRGLEPIAVRVFDPTPERDGYEAVGSVLESNTDDMPFLFDSVTEELDARALEVRHLSHPVVGTERDAEGRILRVGHVRDLPRRESLMHFELDRRLPEEEAAELAARIRRILSDVRLSTGDFQRLQHAVRGMVEIAREGTARYPRDEVEEAVAFLEWLLDLNFVFLGYREYDLVDTPKGRALAVDRGSGLGILSDPEGSTYSEPVLLKDIEPNLRQRIEGGDLLIYSKTNSDSTVHRRARMDYIGVRRVGPDGSLLGEARLVGMFTSKAYMEPASRTPLLNRKLKQILDAEDLMPGSHDYKWAVSLFESFPKDELFAATTEELRRTVVGLLALQEAQHVRVFVRRDLYQRSVSLTVALPRDRFNAELRKRLQAYFVERFNGTGVDYHLALGETDPAQIHFTVHVARGQIPDVPFDELERDVVQMTRTWDDHLLEHLAPIHGEAEARELVRRWSGRFPDYYKTSVPPSLAVNDIARFEELFAGEAPFLVGIQNERTEDGGEPLTRIGLYRTGGKVALSDFMPILEALGLQVVEEVPIQLLGEHGQTYLHDFGVLDAEGRQLDLEASGRRIAEGIEAVWRGEAESDSLNRLVVTAGLSWRQVAILRALRKYRQRVSASFTEEYQNDAFAANPEIAAKLVRLFEIRFDPGEAPDPEAEERLRAEIVADLDSVRSLDHDRILRGHLGVIEATCRTNAYRPGRQYLAFKIISAAVPEMPKPFPLYEIFVYAPELEAIHLRGGMVARGGIRWSDRLEDYRTEVLGLMKAQVTKNALIVPTGSKGGFVLRRPPAEGADVREEVRRQYVTFMRGMLDVTDNLVEGQVVHPPDVRVYDVDDPYLVVAADKGTAALSDTANAVADEYGFWLGDAFASGGSAGYDHKALGITARGAWESVKRHFRELGTDPETEPITVVGIGDMSGDVFGNGMLRSEHLALVAAFDHRHVFIDPDPDPAAAWEERRRLFELPGSSWDDYDRARISEGGGVWPRTEKSIPLSPQARRVLGIEAASLTPAETIRAILRAPVGLLWNGGIGTYVMASDESHADVGDRANDAVRIHARELRCKVVAEGGNLGLTQLGRIEFAVHGGRVNADFIDNSGGVDCSDHEVNLKILLGLALQRGELSLEERNALLGEVVDDVVRHVLYDNYLQAQILSQEVEASPTRMEAYEDLMLALEQEGILEREIEFLPSSEEMAERRAAGRGMARPELAVLLAYAKRSLVAALLRSNLPDDPYLAGDLRDYFPRKVVERFGHLLAEHPLRRELIATVVGNDVVNSQGIVFVSRLVTQTGAEPADVVRAYRTAREVSGAVDRWEAVEALFGKVDPPVQAELMRGVDRLVEALARWYLAHAPGRDLAREIERAREPFARLSEIVTEVGPSRWTEERAARVPALTEAGVPEDVALRHAFQLELSHGPDVIVVARASGRELEDVAAVFFVLGEVLLLDWLESRLDLLPTSTRWHRWAAQAMGDDLMLVRRQLASRVLEEAGSAKPAEAVDAYLAARSEVHARLTRFMRTLAQEDATDLAALTVAVRQVRALVA